MKKIISIFIFSISIICVAQEKEEQTETLQDLICEVEGFTNKIEKGEIVKKILPKESVTVLVKKSTEKFNLNKKEIYIRMHPTKGGFEKFDYILIAGRYKEKSEDLYWDLSTNDSYEIKQINTQFKSPDSLNYISIDKIKGTIIVKKYNLNDNIHFKYLVGNCKPKDLVKVIK
jgi:hypothetical protein